MRDGPRLRRRFQPGSRVSEMWPLLAGRQQEGPTQSEIGIDNSRIPFMSYVKVFAWLLSILSRLRASLVLP